MLPGRPKGLIPAQFVCADYDEDEDNNGCRSKRSLKGMQKTKKSIRNPRNNEPTDLCNQCILHLRKVRREILKDDKERKMEERIEEN